MSNSEEKELSAELSETPEAGSPEGSIPFYEHVSRPGHSRLSVGGGISKSVVARGMEAAAADAAAADAENPEAAESAQERDPDASVPLEYRRRDGSSYDKPAGKDVFEGGGAKIVVEVDELGQEVWANAPQVKDQMLQAAFRNTWEEGPPKMQQFNLGDSTDETKLERLLSKTLPKGSPMVIIYNIKDTFDSVSGHFKVLVKFAEIRYKKILSIK